MDLDKLHSLLHGVPALEQHLDAFRQSGGSDSSEFVALLHDQGLVDGTLLREVLTSGEVTSELAAVSLNAEGQRYRILGFLAQGAMGEVHVARDQHLQRNVAIKRIREPLRTKDAATRRFHTEIAVCAQLDHPGIVPVYSLDRAEDGTVGYAMKLIRGKTLKQVLADVRAACDAGQALPSGLTLRGRLDLFLQACAAIHFAHSRGVIHRDLKPENVMIGPFHEVLVMDWGLARVLHRPDPQALEELGRGGAQHTALGVVLGTPAYLSPEQARGENDALDARSDQFALGLILFEILGLRRAISAKLPTEASACAARAQLDPLVAYPRGEPIPRELAAVVAKATALRAEDRYESVEALAEDLRRYLRDEPVLASPDGPVQSLARWVGRHREATLAVGASALILGMAALTLTVVAASAGFVAQRNAAAAREERLSEVLWAVAAQAHLIDGDFHRYEALLEGLVQSAQLALARPAEPVTVFTGADYRAGRGPEDLAEAKVYGGRVSLGHLDHEVAAGVDQQALLPRLHQIESLRPLMAEILARSDSEALAARPLAEQHHQIRDVGVPAVWVYVALDDGVVSGMPGKGDYPDGYDVRERSWFKNGRQRPHLGWATLDWDESGAGLLLPCISPLRDPGGELIGVAALDVTLQHLVRDLLPLRSLAAPVEAWIVDGQGRVVVNQSLSFDAVEARDNVAAARTVLPFPHEDLRGAIAASPRGYREMKGSDHTELVVWSRLDVADWSYVITGDRDLLLTSGI